MSMWIQLQGIMQINLFILANWMKDINLKELGTTKIIKMEREKNIWQDLKMDLFMGQNVFVLQNFKKDMKVSY